MKIGILTHQLLNNYGGILQNFALQTTLRKMGHEVLTINIKWFWLRNYYLMVGSILKRLFFKIIGKDVVIRALPNKKESEIISHNTRQFINKYIRTTKLTSTKINSKFHKKNNFEAYIVGSDQVWRPVYSPQQSTYFLDFVKNNDSLIKISYAASFGVDKWEFSEKETIKYSSLIRKFDAVSVREDSAIDMCKVNFDVDAIHVLDPTLLLDKDFYENLVRNSGNIKKNNGNLFTYILDKNMKKTKIISYISSKYNLKTFTVMPDKEFSDINRGSVDKCVFPPVEQWIKGFIDAKYVVTDSFHGTVFAILFNKPFISIANESRGLTRFTSLLKMLHLDDRIIFDYDEISKLSFNEIDWKKVNSIILEKRDLSISFLNKHLASPV